MLFDDDTPGPEISVLDDPELAQADLMKVLEGREGRRFIRRIFQDCGVYSPLPVSDPMLMAFLEGKRNVGLALFAQVKACSPNFVTMLLQEDVNNV